MSEALILLFVLGFWMVVITLVAVVVRLRRGCLPPADAEIEELRARYARSEIPREEYERRQRQLTKRP